MKYFFPDYSHYQSDTDPNIFIPLGARMIIVKASDTYNMPLYNPRRYEWSPQNHTDYYYRQNYDRGRAAGLVVIPYAFVRFDRSVQQNLEAFQNATEGTIEDGATIVLDNEQSGTQLKAANLKPADVTDKAKDIVQAFEAHYQWINYSADWWWDNWITDSDWFVERAPLWEAEYVPINPDTHRPVANSSGKWQTHPKKPCKGWLNEYATSVNEMKGKLFAWQFGISPINGKKFDHNLTSMPKEELFKLTKQDGQVDPPGEDNTQAHELLSDTVAFFDEQDRQRVEFVEEQARKLNA